VKIVPVTAERWADLVDLFERRGPRGGMGLAGNGCWCMWWRERTGDASRNKEALRRLAESGRPPGLLAYADGVAVGWVSIAPRDEYGQLTRSKHYGPTEDERGIWAIACFYVHGAARHQGVAEALLDGAIEHAFAGGGTSVEAYPHNRRPDYMGSAEMFERRGFEPIRTTTTRTVVRLSARRPRARGRGPAAPSG
jgi:ribosomal protein S18 acetylase RimI-like enzyme